MSLAIVQHAAARRTRMRARPRRTLSCELLGAVARTPALRHLQADATARQQWCGGGIRFTVRAGNLAMQGLHVEEFLEDAFAMAAADIV